MLGHGEKREKRINIRLTLTEYKRLKFIAKRHEYSMTDMISALINVEYFKYLHENMGENS